MEIQTDAQGYVTDYALVGRLEQGVLAEPPEDWEQFERDFPAFRWDGRSLIYSPEQARHLQQQAELHRLRMRREQECFSVINRGQLWYEGLTLSQLLELRKWYQAWLSVTETGIVPEPPVWLKKAV